MKRISRFIVIAIFIISSLVGIFPVLANTFVYYLLYSLLFALSCCLLVFNLKQENRKKYFASRRPNFILLLILLFIVFGIVAREIKVPLYALGFFNMLLSYYSLFVADVDDLMIKRLSFLAAFMLIPTILFNGFLNFNLESGVAFSGRMNPLFYFPYILFAIRSVRGGRKKVLYWIFNVEILLIIIDLWWAGSRIAIISMVIVLVALFLFDKKNLVVTKKIKRIIKLMLGLIIIIHILYPVFYVNLSEKHSTELNQYSLSLTSKDFFSGRQNIWKAVFMELTNDEVTELFGTGDVGYEKIKRTPHNDFIGVYYLWGIIVASLVYLYIFRIGCKCIDNMSDRKDLIVILAFIMFIACSSNETIMYSPHFFIFEKILTSNLLWKRFGKLGDRSNTVLLRSKTEDKLLPREMEKNYN